MKQLDQYKINVADQVTQIINSVGYPLSVVIANYSDFFCLIRVGGSDTPNDYNSADYICNPRTSLVIPIKSPALAIRFVSGLGDTIPSQIASSTGHCIITIYDTSQDYRENILPGASTNAAPLFQPTDYYPLGDTGETLINNGQTFSSIITATGYRTLRIYATQNYSVSVLGHVARLAINLRTLSGIVLNEQIDLIIPPKGLFYWSIPLKSTLSTVQITATIAKQSDGVGVRVTPILSQLDYPQDDLLRVGTYDIIYQRVTALTPGTPVTLLTGPAHVYGVRSSILEVGTKPIVTIGVGNSSIPSSMVLPLTSRGVQSGGLTSPDMEYGPTDFKDSIWLLSNQKLIIQAESDTLSKADTWVYYHL